MFLDTPYDMALDAANRFRQMRLSKRMTIKELSERSGVPNSTIRRFEHSGEIGFLALVKLASALDEDEQIRALFRDTVPGSIEEVIRANHR